jgi:hypothetical protein
VISDRVPVIPPTRRAACAIRRRVSRWHRLAALLALLTPLAQQRPALLDGVPMAHAGGASAGHQVAAISVAVSATATTGSHAPHTHAPDTHTPAAPRGLWCCELAAIAVVAIPWNVPSLVAAPVVAFCVAPLERCTPRTTRVSQLRLPFATAPPALMA